MSDRLRVVDVIPAEEKPWWQSATRSDFRNRTEALPLPTLQVLKSEMDGARCAMIAVAENTLRDPDQRRRARYAAALTGEKTAILRNVISRKQKENTTSNAKRAAAKPIKKEMRAAAIKQARESLARGDLAQVLGVLLDLIDPDVDWEQGPQRGKVE